MAMVVRCELCGEDFMEPFQQPMPICENCRGKESTVKISELRNIVIDMRRYFIRHGLLTSECVAWEQLKLMTGVGQDYDCPSEDARQ